MAASIYEMLRASDDDLSIDAEWTPCNSRWSLCATYQLQTRFSYSLGSPWMPKRLLEHMDSRCVTQPQPLP